MPRLSKHARDRMAERGITDADVRSALNRRSGQPRVGSNGTIAVLGYASGGRILKLVLTPNQEEIITLAWPDE
jgi:dienelactone hydrolase